MSTFVRFCRSILLFCSVAAVTLSAVHAQQTLRVPQDYSTIQAAINAGHTGDTVSVAPGTYFENLTVDTKEITLSSTAGSATTILDGSHLGPVLQITNTPGVATVVTGFTIQNGTAPPPPSNIPVLTGGGIYAINAGLNVANSTFRSIIGPSLVASNSTLSLNSSTITTTDGSACTNAGVGQHSGVFLNGDSVITANGAPVPSTILGNTISGDGSFCAGEAITLQSLTSQTLIQNNTLRNNLGGVEADSSPFSLVQNLIFDNGLGAVGIGSIRSASPSTGPATTFLINNTMVNNHTSQDLLNGPYTTEIGILNSAAQVAMRNNIIIGTTQYAILSCQSDSQDSTASDTPLLLDHNDLFNTSGGLVLSGSCFPNLASPLTMNGNLSVDPRFSSSTDLRPLAGSPVLDAGINLVGAPLTDIVGSPRIADSTGKGYPVIDLGAYERAAAISATIPTTLNLQPAVFTLAPGNLSLSVRAQYFTALGAAPLGTGSVTILLNGSPTSATAELDPNGNASLSLPLTSAGVYALSATLSPSPGFAPATSPVVYVLVTSTPQLPTTLTIAASPATQTLNQPITLTIRLGSTTTTNGVTTAGPVPPGALTLSEGNTILSSLQPDSSGLVTYTIPKPAVGNHIYTVSYAGTTTYSAATASTAVSVTAPAATTLTASITPNPAALGQTITLSASVSSASATPTGSVTFTDGATTLGTLPLSAGIATFSLSSLSAGLHTITIAYAPDPAFAASSTTRTVLVGGDATSINLSSAKNPATTTDTVLYTATVSNTSSAAGTAAPAGSVSLSEGTTLLASAPLSVSASGASVAFLPVTLFIPGAHILTATYIPATTASLASTGTLTETITAAPPILTALSATPNPIAIGQTVTLSASVSSAAPLPPSATILFSDGAAPLGSVPLAANGTATLAISTFSIGTHQVSAALRTPDSAADRSVSNSLLVQVNGLVATLHLSASPSPTALATAPITLTANLQPATTPPAGASLAGTVTFFDGPVPLGIAALSSDGQATFSLSALSAGLHSLTANFSGNSLFASALSQPVSESVLLNATSTQLLAPSQSTAYAPITLAAHITSGSTATRISTPTCTPACTPVTVNFIATTPSGSTTLGIVPVDASGNASLTIDPAVGIYGLVATFNGSALFSGSSSASSTLTVIPAATALTLSANPNPAYQHSAITLSAALTAPGIPASSLTGTITFLEGSTALGNATLAAAQSFLYTPTTVGAHTLTAVFSGSGSLSGSSATITVTVLPSDFVLSVKDQTLTISTTHHAPTTISINTTGALADLIDLSCANLPADAHCTFAPATHDLTAANTSTGTLTIDTDALLNYAGVRPRSSPFSGRGTGFTAILALAIPPMLLGSMTRLRRRSIAGSARPSLPHLLAALLLSVASVTLAGCSGLYPPHVAPGTYTITITGHARSSGIEHSAPLNLVVTP